MVSIVLFNPGFERAVLYIISRFRALRGQYLRSEE